MKRKKININIFETIYHAALEKSYEISKERRGELFTLSELYDERWHFKPYHQINVDGIDIHYNHPHSRDYIILKETEASKLKNSEINCLLRKIKPVFKEIKNMQSSTWTSSGAIGAYSSFQGSPLSEGILQFDLWDVKPSDRYDWDQLRENIKKIWGAKFIASSSHADSINSPNTRK